MADYRDMTLDGTLTSATFVGRFVKLVGNDTVGLAVAAGQEHGILLNYGTTGTVAFAGQGIPVTSGAALTAGQRVTSDASGKAVVGNGSGVVLVGVAGADQTAYIALGGPLTTSSPAPGSANGGTEELDFGAFPGASMASVAITGQAGILGNSSVTAALVAVNTVDHTIEEHLVEEIDVRAGNIVAGVGFTIYGVVRARLTEPTVVLPNPGPGLITSSATAISWTASQQRGRPDDLGGKTPRVYGRWRVAWQWV